MARNASEKPTLVDYLASRYLWHVVEKGWFGKQRVRLGRLLELESHLFETGAVLGRALRDSLELVATTFSQPGRQKNAVTVLFEMAERCQQSYHGEQECGLFVFYLATRSPLFSFEANYAAFLADAKSRLSVQDAFDNARAAMSLGIGFGARYPDLTEAMHRRSYQHVDENEWKKWHDFGLGIPEQPETVTLEEREQEVLLEVAAFMTEYYPELREPLGLNLAKADASTAAASVGADRCPSCGQPRPSGSPFCDDCTLRRMHQH